MRKPKLDGKITVALYEDKSCKIDIENLSKKEIGACILALTEQVVEDFPDLKAGLFLGLFELI